jgi:hypothetical protein
LEEEECRRILLEAEEEEKYRRILLEVEEEEEVGVCFHVYICNVSSYFLRRNGPREVFVKWLGWSKKFNSWILEEDIADI